MTSDTVPVTYDLAGEPREATGIVHPFCSNECRDAFIVAHQLEMGTGRIALGREDAVGNFGFVPKCDQCGSFIRCYHGTRSRFRPGQVIGADSYAPISVTTDPDDAMGWALSVDHFAGRKGRPKVYEVEPLDEPVLDPGWEDCKSFRVQNARVIREVDPDGSSRG